MTLLQAMNLITAQRINPRLFTRSFAPSHPNPWPDGVCVEWVRGRGWVPCFGVDADELLADFHGKQRTPWSSWSPLYTREGGDFEIARSS